MGRCIVADTNEDTLFKYRVLSMCSKSRLMTRHLYKYIILGRRAIKLVNLITSLYD